MAELEIHHEEHEPDGPGKVVGVLAAVLAVFLAVVTIASHRTHTEAIGWLYRVEDTGLRIPKTIVRRFAGSEGYETAIRELLLAGLNRLRRAARRSSHWPPTSAIHDTASDSGAGVTL